MGALVKLGSPEGVSEIVRALKDPNDGLCLTAIVWATKVGDPRAVDALKTFAKETDDQEARQWARRELAEWEGSGVNVTDD